MIDFSSQIKVGIFVVFLGLLAGLGWYIKTINDENIECKVNTKIQKQQYKEGMDRYEEDIKSIVTFYDEEKEKVNKFKRRDNETDCQASRRFLDSASY